ncbi:MAG TPA: hypothetical protein VEI97_09220, partial [bacterium]|nr:hypothetical protein [bacterium]
MPRASFLLLSCLCSLLAGPVLAGPPALEFIPNQGQWPQPVRLRADVAPGLTVFLENQRFTFLRYDASAWAHQAHQHGHPAPRPAAGQASLHSAARSTTIPAHAWSVDFVAASPSATPKAVGQPFGPVRNY